MKVTKTIYRCDFKFHIDDIIAMYDEYENHGVLYTDGEKCVWFKFQNNTCTKMKEIKFKLQNQFKSGGYSANRLARNRDIQRTHHITEIGEKTIEIFMKINPKSVIFCGPGSFKIEVMTSKNINSYYEKTQKTILKSLTLCDDDFNKMCDSIKDMINTIDNDNDEFYKIQGMIIMADDRLIFGEDDIINGLHNQIISTVYLHDDYFLDIENLMIECKKVKFKRISNATILDYGGIIGIKYF